MEYKKIATESIVDLNQISLQFEMDKDELIRFHNQHCALHEILPMRLEKYVPYLYIPVERYQNWHRKQVAGDAITIPYTYGRKMYGIIIKQDTSDLKIHYLVQVEKDAYSITIDKKKTFVNDSETESMIEKLVESAGQALYPIQLALDEHGGISDILNAKEIQQRWNAEYLPHIQQYYSGEVSEEIIAKLQQFYKGLQTAKVEQLYRNIFFTLYFMPIYKNLADSGREYPLRLYSSVTNQWVVYQSHFQLQKTYTETDRICITISGEEDTRNQERGSLQLTYHLDRNTYGIINITGYFSVFDSENRKITTSVELYQQK